MRKYYRPILFEDLAKYSPWPARLLGREWKGVVRDAKKIDEEYNRGNYARCLERFESNNWKVSMEDLRTVEFGGGNPEVVISHGDELALAKLTDAYEEHYNMIERAVAPHVEDGDTLIELGCGYGYNLALLKKRLRAHLKYRGGEYAETAVTLARKFFDGNDTQVEKFDFYSPKYQIIENVSAPVVIFTAHAIEQIPDISNMFDVLSKHKSKIKAVVHIEPVYEFQGDGALGALRKRYIEACDYNRNLYTEITRRKEIEMTVCEKNIFGINGINPSSIIAWRFRQ